MILKRQEKDNKIKAMYKSSTILASVFESDTKNLTIIFANGGQYKYKDVSLADYTRFETADSQGIVLNAQIKKYPFEKLSPVDPTAIVKEITELSTVGTKTSVEKVTKLLLDNMTKCLHSYIWNGSLDTASLSLVEASIIEFNKVSKPVAPASQVVVS